MELINGASSLLLRVASPVLVGLVCALIGASVGGGGPGCRECNTINSFACGTQSIAFVHSSELIPWYGQSSRVVWFMHGSFFALVVLETAVHYAKCVFKAPGSPSRYLMAPHEEEELRASQRWCKRCDAPKPVRTHHCSFCGRCILAMDHHCPWVANCVGFHNYRSFVLFVVFACVGCAYVSVCAAFAMFSSTPYLVNGSSSSSVLGMFVFSVALTISLGCLAVYHMILVCFGMTTLEFLKRLRSRLNTGDWANPFDLGWQRNVISVMGPPGVLGVHWLNPFSARGRPGDGMHWKIAPLV